MCMQAAKPDPNRPIVKPEAGNKENVGEAKTPAAATKQLPSSFRHNLTPPSTGCAPLVGMTSYPHYGVHSAFFPGCCMLAWEACRDGAHLLNISHHRPAPLEVDSEPCLVKLLSPSPQVQGQKALSCCWPAKGSCCISAPPGSDEFHRVADSRAASSPQLNK